MSLPEKEEHGVKLFAWNNNKLATSVPIKKRRFVFRRSPSPPPHSTTLTADNCDPQPKGTNSPGAESSGLSDQVSGCANIRDSSLGCRVESFTNKEVNLSQNCDSSPSFSGGLLFTLSPTADAATGCSGPGEIGDGEKLISENSCAFWPILATNSEVTNFRSTLGDGNCGNKLILSDKSAFQRVLANTELPLPLNRQSSGEPVALVTSAKEGQCGSCKLELTLSESQLSFLSKRNDSQLELSHNDQHSNRSHWDLNTTMDTWESSVVDATLKHRGCSNDKNLDMGDMHLKRPEMDPIEKSRQESTGLRSTSGTYALSESACSLELPSTLLKSLSETCVTNTDLNLQLNTTFGSLSLSNLGVPFGPNIPSTNKVSNFSFSDRPITLTQTNFNVSNTVKTEPVEQEGGNGKNIGASNFKSVSKNIIKSEASDAVQQEVLKAVCPSGASTPCGSVVKSEQLEVPCVEGPRAAEGKTQYHGNGTNARGTVNTREMHHDAKGGDALSLNLVTQSLFVDCNKVLDIPGPTNIVTSKVMGESPCKAMPVFAAKPPVLNEPNVDLGAGMPSNADQAHGASPNIGSPTKVSPQSIVSCNDSQSFYLAPACVVTHDSKESVIKASELLSESNAMVDNELGQVKGTREVVDSTSVLDSESKEQTVADYMPGNGEQMPYPDGGAQLCESALVDACTSHTSFDSKVSETDAKGEVKQPESCNTVNEARGSYESAGAKEIASKLHGDDDDYEDGELIESLLRDGIKGSRNAKEKKDVNVKEGVKSDVPVIMSSFVSGNENKLQNSDESKDVHCTMEVESCLGTEEKDVGLNVTEDEKESSVIGMPVTESSKKEAVNVSCKMPEELGKDDPETKTTCEKNLRSSPEKGPDNTGDDLGNQLTKATADQFGPSKGDASRTYDASERVRSRSDRSHVVHLSSLAIASSGRIKSSRSRSSSRSERERVTDKSVKREKVHLTSSRDESHIHRTHKSEKERDQDQTLRKAGSSSMRMRGRNQQSDILHGVCYPDRGYASEHFNMSTSSQLSRSKNASEVAFAVGMDGMFESAGRTGKRHMDDELCRPPPRRPSPGGRGPPPVGVQMVRRTMRDVSPGRCIEGGIPELVMLNREGKLTRGFADNMVNSSLILRARPNYEPGENCLIRRERSLSPFQRRAAPHVPHIPFALSTRPRVRSPHLWSPRRSPDGFDGHPDLIRCRSPDLRVERVRSPGERACFQENMMGRRHISPHMPQLHGEMTDVNLLRGHDLPKGRHPQGNPRRFEVIDHRVNPDNFGHLQSGQFRGLEGDDVYPEERRNSDEGHGLARPFRQHYIVGDGVGNDGSFHSRIEDIPPPRPIRLCQDVDREFPGRNISRGGGIRNRLGNMHRRLRGVDEPEDNYRHDNGQGWHGDVRLKRRRF